MKKYISFFRLRFSMGIQYRAAAAAGIVTQYAWGFLEIMVFFAFYEADASAFPMTLSQTVTYVWLQQSFFCLFVAWMMENEIFDTIMNGNIAYELCHPVKIYYMWLSRSLANRVSRTVLRSFPILLVAVLLPSPWGISAPASLFHFVVFTAALLLGLGVTVAFCTLVYILAFFTVSAQGLRIFFTSVVEFLAGGIIPLPFLPDGLRLVLELLPFASMQNVPLRVYSGNMSGTEMRNAIALQIFWLAMLVLLGQLLCKLAEKRITVQGG